jgi:hypothetical protein
MVAYLAVLQVRETQSGNMDRLPPLLGARPVMMPSRVWPRLMEIARRRTIRVEEGCVVSQEDIVHSLLDYLRSLIARPGLAYAETPIRMSGGYDATILKFALRSAPDPFSGPLVLRLFQATADARRAPREAAVQNALAELGYLAPRVLIAEARIEPLGGPFLIMERRLGRPLGSEFEGLSINGFGRTLDILRQLPRIRRDVLRLWDGRRRVCTTYRSVISSIELRGPASLARTLR